MKIFKLPGEIKALIFDMDLTLYSNPEYGQFQIDILIKRLGKQKGLSFREMEAEVEKKRKALTLSRGGKTPSLSCILETYGISTEENVRWRNELYKPEKFLKENNELAFALEKLIPSLILGVVTNNPVFIARRTLAALGVEACFSVIIGLDTCMAAKPDKKPFLEFVKLSGCPPASCVSIGDRYDIDLDIPLELGMGGILVDGVKDLYSLPSLLGL